MSNGLIPYLIKRGAPQYPQDARWPLALFWAQALYECPARIRAECGPPKRPFLPMGDRTGRQGAKCLPWMPHLKMAKALVVGHNGAGAAKKAGGSLPTAARPVRIPTARPARFFLFYLGAGQNRSTGHKCRRHPAMAKARFERTRPLTRAASDAGGPACRLP